MLNTLQVYYELRETMDSTAAEKIAQVIGKVYDELRESVTKTEFNDLRAVVAELAQAQRESAATEARTEQRLDTLAQRMEELAAAQQRTEQRVDTLAQRMDELAAAQVRTEQRMDELADAQTRTEFEIRRLTHQVGLIHEELGGVGRGMGYALENEAYRMLPGWLKREHGIHITQRFVRKEIGGQEVNLFAQGRRNGHKILLVGEAKVQLDERKRRAGAKDVFTQLNDKVRVVQAAYPKMEIVPLLVTHFAREKMLERAQTKGIIVVQSFEW
jgi:multidrug efflux pump subunit AcrA (membrane-fusion protein)